VSNEERSVPWESRGCRDEIQEDLYPGRRACHLTCNTCLQPDNWPNCNDCELVGHCRAALERIKNLKLDKGQYFRGQLTGEETLYHVLHFVNSHQRIINKVGEEEYMEELKQENLKPTKF